MATTIAIVMLGLILLVFFYIRYKENHKSIKRIFKRRLKISHRNTNRKPEYMQQIYRNRSN